METQLPSLSPSLSFFLSFRPSSLFYFILFHIYFSFLFFYFNLNLFHFIYYPSHLGERKAYFKNLNLSRTLFSPVLPPSLASLPFFFPYPDLPPLSPPSVFPLFSSPFLLRFLPTSLSASFLSPSCLAHILYFLLFNTPPPPQPQPHPHPFFMHQICRRKPWFRANRYLLGRVWWCVGMLRYCSSSSHVIHLVFFSLMNQITFIQFSHDAFGLRTVSLLQSYSRIAVDFRVKGLARGLTLGFKFTSIAGLHCYIFYTLMPSSHALEEQELLSPKYEVMHSGPVDSPRRHAGSAALHHFLQLQPAIFPPKTTNHTQDLGIVE